VGAELRGVPVAVSVEALRHQWARQRAAPAGFALAADTEIAARIRGGVEWKAADATAVAVLARPVTLEPSDRDLAWLAAGLAAARAHHRPGGPEAGCVWPDTVEVGPGDRARVVTGAVCTLASGRVDYAILVVRFRPTGSIDPPLDTSALIKQLRLAAGMLDEPTRLVSAYNRRFTVIGRTVAVSLLPHGTTRGSVRGAAPDGRLEIESPTGLRERIAVSSFASLRLLEE